MARASRSAASTTEKLPLGAGGETAPASAHSPPLASGETDLLRSVVHGLTNAEIATEMGVAEDVIARRLAELSVKIGASTRADATSMAIMGRLV